MTESAEGRSRQDGAEELRWSEVSFRALIEHLSEPVFVRRRDGDPLIRYVNPAMGRLLGYAPAELVGRNSLELVHPDDMPTMVDHRHALDVGEPRPPLRMRWLRRDGTPVWIEGRRVDAVVDGIPSAIVLIRDRTEAQRAEDERERFVRQLQSSEERYRAMFESSPLPKLLFDAESLRFLDANAAAEKLYGYTKAEFLQRRVFDLKPTEGYPETVREMARLQEAATSGEPILGKWSGLRKHRREDGELIDVDMTAQGVMVDGRAAQLVTCNDVTEKLRLEEKLRQSQKMDAIGQLAGGIAHDFNNLLSVILGTTSVLLDEIPPGGQLRDDLENVKQAGQRAADLTGQLLAFSRQTVLQPCALDLNEIVKGITPMLGRLLGAGVDLRFMPSLEAQTIWVDSSQLEQVIMNLAVNARDAMPRGGTLRIEVGREDLDPSEIGSRPGAHHVRRAAPGARRAYAVLTVTDDGQGMTLETKARLFEPFFTTKEKGKGTGLGLSTVFGIVKQSGGQVRVSSELGRGSTFRVYFPLVEAPSVSASSDPAAPLAPKAGAETVLLVEDEEQVRKLAVRILQRRGYDVLEAASPGDAIVISESFAGTIHLLFTDVVMPRMRGPELARRLRLKRPEMKVLFTSGYFADDTEPLAVPGQEVHFLQKPVTPSVLLGKVRTLLDAQLAPISRRGEALT